MQSQRRKVAESTVVWSVLMTVVWFSARHRENFLPRHRVNTIRQQLAPFLSTRSQVPQNPAL
eukprot:6197764-Pleurochrysis_carterae.AAC.1